MKDLLRPSSGESTGKFATKQELDDEVMRLSRLKKFSDEYISEQVGVTPAVVSKIRNGYKNGSNKAYDDVQLAALLHEVWKPTSAGRNTKNG